MMKSLKKAVSDNDVDRVKLLLSTADAEAMCEALETAVFKNNIELARLLISHGARVDASTFSRACERSHGTNIEFLELFLNQHGGLVVDTMISSEFGALEMACTDPDVMEWLLKHGLNPNLECQGGSMVSKGPFTPMDAAIFDQKDPYLLEMVSSYGGKVTKNSLFLATPRNGSISEEVVEWLLDHGADPNVEDELYGPALHHAVKLGGLEMVRLLLARGADISKTARHGMTALDTARALKRETIVAFLESYNEVDRDAHSARRP